MTNQAKPQPPKADAPIEAFRFAADFEPSEVASDGTVPFKALARTSQPVAHWHWGDCLHDFAGMTSKPSITVDYNHYDDEALGFVNEKTVTPEGLLCAGALTPFTPTDKASEVIFKAGKGVKYECSVYFDPWSCVVEEVPSGFTTEVNGQTFSGPVTVFRQWELIRLAVCLSGVDGGTNVSFSKNLSGQKVAVNRFSKKEKVMTTKTEQQTGKFATMTEDEKKSLETVAKTLTTIIEGATVTETETETETTTETTTEAGAASETVKPEDTTQLSRKTEGAKFISEFGERHGATLFAKGFTFQQAEAEFRKILRTENEALRTENAKFAKSQNSNGATPVTFDTPSTTQSGETKFRGLSGGIAKFASGIKLPVKQ